MADQNTERQKILDAIARIAKDKGKNVLSRDEFSSATGISSNRIYQCFDGWRDACEQAGIIPNTEKIRIEDTDLFDEMRRVFELHGGICTRSKFDKLSNFSVDTLKKRYGPWQSILAAFRDWLEQNKVEFQHMSSLPVGTPAPSVPGGPEYPKTYLTPAQTGKGPTYGAFLNFRGLQHAPVNEQGVVFLFGMVCHELGFVVELIRTGFPDCEAKRCINPRRDQWERVRIEFEFKATNARVHQLSGCDLIVCWENDWPDCPVEVIELKTKISSLDVGTGPVKA